MDQMAMPIASALPVSQARRALPWDAAAWAARSSPTYAPKMAMRIENATARRLYCPVSREPSGIMVAPLLRVEGRGAPKRLWCQARIPRGFVVTRTLPLAFLALQGGFLLIEMPRGMKRASCDYNLART